MRRREFLHSATAVAIAQFLTGCGNNQNAFRVELLKSSLPGQLINRFQRSWQSQQQVKLQVSPLGRVEDAFTHLQNWRFRDQIPQPDNLWTRMRQLPVVGEPPTPVANLVSIPDYWLQAAIQQQLIQPIDVSKLQHWSNLAPKWQQLVTRDDQGFVSPQGKIWAAPFRWGTTVIVYRRDQFARNGWNPPRDWDDLWRPELRDRISLLDHPRETIGLVLKKLGKSYNTATEDLNSIPNLTAELSQLHQQTKFYSSDRYLEPLIIGDTFMAVGWSNEVIPLITSDPRFAAIVPQRGTALWADLWVIPYQHHPSTSSQSAGHGEWIDFFWKQENARQLTIGSKVSTPIPTQIQPNDIPQNIANLLIIDPNIIKNSELILPLPAKVTRHYFEFFNQIKQQKLV